MSLVLENSRLSFDIVGLVPDPYQEVFRIFGA